MIPPKLVFAANAGHSVGAGHVRRLIEVAKALPEGIEKLFVGTVTLEWLREIVQNTFLHTIGDTNKGTRIPVILDSYDQDFCDVVKRMFPNSNVIQIADRYTYLVPDSQLIFMDLPFQKATESIDWRTLGHGIEFLPIRKMCDGQRIFQDRAKRVLVTTGGSVNESVYSQLFQELEKEVYSDISFHFMVPASFHRPTQKNLHFHNFGTNFDLLVSECDTSISAAGTTMWDLLANQVITGLVATVSNQEANLEYALRYKYAISVFDYPQNALEVGALQALLFDKDVRQTVFQEPQKQFDFLGAQRTSKLILQALQ